MTQKKQVCCVENTESTKSTKHIALRTLLVLLVLLGVSSLIALTTLDAHADETLVTISGHVAEGNDSLSGVVISAGDTLTTTTDADGVYRFTDIVSGTYILTPAQELCTFSPMTRTVKVETSDVVGQDFAATCMPAPTQTYTITGSIVDMRDVPEGGVTLWAGTQYSTTTNVNGFYTFVNLPAGTYTVTPTKQNCSFTPASFTATGPPDVTQPVIATCISEPTGPYTITGSITDYYTEVPEPGVTLWAGTQYSTTTDMNGSYTLANLPAGTYIVIPTKENHLFYPASFTATGPPDVTRYFTSEQTNPFTITGLVADYRDVPVDGVTLLIGTQYSTTTTISGTYMLANLPAGTYTLTPTKERCTFEPSSIEVRGPPDTIRYFTASCQPDPNVSYTISGRLADNTGTPLSRVTMQIQPGTIVKTDSSGIYTFTNLFARTYTITPTSTKCSFQPVSRSITVPPNQTEVDFVATCDVPYAISGYITFPNGDPVPGVSVATDTDVSMTTLSDGSYILSGLQKNIYLVTPEKTNCFFNPAMHIVAVPPSQEDLNFTATCNSAPTDIVLTHATVMEGQTVGTVVGSFYTVDPDSTQSFYTGHSLRLVSGRGDEDNAAFTLENGVLKTAQVFAYDTQSTYHIRVRTRDQGDLKLEKQFTITVTRVGVEVANVYLPLITRSQAAVPASTPTPANTQVPGMTPTPIATQAPLATPTATQAPVAPTATLLPTPTPVSGTGGPVVNWVQPVGNDGRYDVGTQSLQLEVAVASDVAIAAVQFYRWDAVNETYIHMSYVYSAPYRVELDTSTLNSGWNDIFAKAYDVEGNISQREHIFVVYTGSGK